MTEIHNESKRKFIRALGATTASLLLTGQLTSPGLVIAQSLSPEVQTPSVIIQKPRKTIYSILGMHDAPRVGCSLDLELMKTHLSAIGVKFVIGHMPAPEWYNAVRSIGATPIVRLNLPDNRFNADIMNSQLATAPKGSFVVPYNEKNQSGEVGWNPMFPEEAAQEDYNAFGLIVAHGCIPMISPLSPGGNLENKDGSAALDKNKQGYDEDRYFYVLMQAHGALGTFKDFPQAVLGMHAYDFKYHNPTLPAMWDRLKRLNETSILPIAGKIPIYIKEGGFFLADVEPDKINHQIIGQDIESFLNQDLFEVAGPDLGEQIKSYGWWIYANYAQISPTDHSTPRFERSALYEAINGREPKTNEMYEAFVRYHQAHKGSSV
jgi:hypothetical protein